MEPHQKILRRDNESSDCRLNTGSCSPAACRRSTCRRWCRNGLMQRTRDLVQRSVTDPCVGQNPPTFAVKNGAVRAQVLLVVPGHVPALPWGHAAAFATNAGHAHLWKGSIDAKISTVAGGRLIFPALLFIKVCVYPWYVAVHGFGVRWSQATWVVGGLASFALQHWLWWRRKKEGVSSSPAQTLFLISIISNKDQR